MKDINDIMPKLPKDTFGAVLNYTPTNIDLHQLSKSFVFDSKWHTILQHDRTVTIDGKTIRKESKELMT